MVLMWVVKNNCFISLGVFLESPDALIHNTGPLGTASSWASNSCAARLLGGQSGMRVPPLSPLTPISFQKGHLHLKRCSRSLGHSVGRTPVRIHSFLPDTLGPRHRPPTSTLPGKKYVLIHHQQGHWTMDSRGLTS